jgi:multidrug efflux pump subunit AcrA (membrane-fusion protein)
VDNSSEPALLATAPLTIIDPGELELVLDIPYHEGLLVKPGQQAGVSLGDIQWQTKTPSDKEGPLVGRVYSISPLLNPTLRTTRVKVRLTQKQVRLLDGMFVSCWIEVATKPQALLVPLGTLLFEGNEAYVYVLENSKAYKRKVVLGLSDTDHVEVVAGLEDGQLLATKGRRLLHPGMEVKLVSAGERSHDN